MLLDANYDESMGRWDVHLYGEVDIYNADSLKSELHALVDEKKPTSCWTAPTSSILTRQALACWFPRSKRSRRRSGRSPSSI